MAAKIHTTPLGDAWPIKLKVEILDKVIFHPLIDEGSGIKIMLFSTLKKRGLEMTLASPYIVNMADQC